MYLKSLTIHNLRQFEKTVFEFDPNLTLIQGDNTTGKSTILEAIHLVCNGGSPWTKKNGELVNYESNEGFVRIEAEIVAETNIKTNKIHTISVFHDNGTIIREINGRKINTHELPKYCTTNLFSPDQIDMLMFSPGQRRDFMNELFCRLDLDYSDALRNFRKTLRQRNAYLKTLFKPFKNSTITGNGTDDSQLRYWSDELAKHGAYLGWKRRELLQQLSENCEGLVILYRADLCDQSEEFADMADLTGLIHLYQKQLEANSQRDIITGFTTIGVHRDDWELQIDPNARNLRSFGSRGEKRMGIGNIILGAQALLQKNLGYFPILLLDDISSELDSKNTQLFLEDPRVQQQQAIVTCLIIPDFLTKGKKKAKEVINLKG